jgi:hypothetical protein
LQPPLDPFKGECSSAVEMTIWILKEGLSDDLASVFAPVLNVEHLSAGLAFRARQERIIVLEALLDLREQAKDRSGLIIGPTQGKVAKREREEREITYIYIYMYVCICTTYLQR